MTEPIIILGMPRSGSSMTAGIFAKHGVWTGRCRGPAEHNAKGFFESKAIKHVIIKTYGAKRIVHEGRVAERQLGFKDAVLLAIAKDGYAGGDWLWKGSALYRQAFHEFSPKWVCCRRPVEQILRSCRGSGVFGAYLSDARLIEIIELHNEQMDLVENRFDVDTCAVSQGDYSSVELALEGCGIEPDREKIDAFVDRSLWKYK